MCLEPTFLLEEVAHKKETEASDQTMISDVWGVVIVFVGAIEYHGNDGKYQHDCFTMFALIEHIC
jgi:hypothetical protein